VFLSGRSKEEVQAKRIALLAQVQRGTYTPPAKESFGAYLWRWLGESSGRYQPSTMHSHRNVVRQVNEDPIGSIPLRSLMPANLEGYYARKRKPKVEGGGGLSPNAVRNHHRVIHAALERARKHKLIGENPASFCDLPAAVEFEPQIFESEHLRLFLGEAKRTSRFYPLYLVAATTGMRLSELLGARWSDLRPDGIYQVRQAFVRVPHVSVEASFKGPKTKQSRRPVVIDPSVIAVLDEVHAEQEQHKAILGDAYCDRGLIFCQANGKPLHAHNIMRRDFKPILRRAGLPESFRFHGFRHSHLSHLERLGVAMSVAQERAGHSNQQMTLHYTHLGDGQRDAARAVVDDLGLRP
jgi:integrase